MAERAAEGVADGEEEEMIESIENLEDMKVVTLWHIICNKYRWHDVLYLLRSAWFFSSCYIRSDSVSLAAGPHCKGVGVHGGSETGDLQSIQELSEDPC